MIEKISTQSAPAAIGPYSQAISVNGLLFTSGQIPLIPETGEMLLGDIRAQTERVMQNLGAVLSAGKASFDSIIKTTCFLADIKDFAAFNEIYAKYISSAPARSCVAVKDLPRGALVEVEAVAEINAN